VDSLFIFPSTISQQNVETTLQRTSLYGYETLQLGSSLRVTGGLTYDRLHFPRDIDTSPITGETAAIDQFSPKFAITWTPEENTHIRAAYSRSLGGVFFDNSVRLEPTEIGGFNQALRSVIPESVVGLVPGTRFTTYGVGVDHAFKSHTYLSLEAQVLQSEAQRTVGIVTNSFFFFNAPVSADSPSNTRQNLNFDEKSLVLTLNQLLGRDWSFGVRYQISRAHLDGQFVDLPTGPAATINQDQTAVLNQLNLSVNYYHPSGFFAQGQALWTSQSNRGYTPDEGGDDFWQLSIYGGYRFLHRAAEIRVGLLNITDRDYQLNPLNLYYELPRGRTLAVSFKFYF